MSLVLSILVACWRIELLLQLSSFVGTPNRASTRLRRLFLRCPPANRHGDEGYVVRESTPALLFMVMVLQQSVCNVFSFIAERLDLDIIVKFES